MRSKSLLFVVPVVLALGGALLLVQRNRTAGGGPRVDIELPPELDERETAPTQPVPGAVLEREPAAQSTASRGLSGRVLAAGGDPIAGATVTLSCPTTADSHCEPVWRNSDWGVLDRGNASALTDPEGRFLLEIIPAQPAHGLVIWGSHPDFTAGVLVLPPDQGSWPASAEIVLQPGRPMRVSVVDSSGQPVRNARVEQFGLAGELADNTTTQIDPARARRFFHRVYDTTEQAQALVAAFEGEQVLIARRGDEATIPWRGSWREEVVLTLRPTFEVGGTLTLPEMPDDPTRERRLTIAGQTGNVWRELASIRAVEHGPWGPVTLPRVDAQRYRIRLEGAPIVPVEVYFPPPAPGSRLTKNLVAEIGDELWFKVVDEQGRVIPTARVRASWPDPDQPRAQRHAEASRTKEDQIGIVSVPRGSFTYEAWAPGYAWVQHGPLETSICQSAHVRTELQKGGILRGSVRHRGQPVEDFEVLIWQPTSDLRPRTETFLGRADGTFELDSMPAGEHWLTASSSATPACEPITVTFAPGSVTEVTLELLDGLPGQGRVLDAATGLPLHSASVQLYVKGDVTPAARWGIPVPVEADGTFTVRGYLPGQNYIRALADGYSSRVLTKTIEKEPLLQWGDIALARAQDFTIVVDPPESGRGATVATRGQAELPSTPFSEAGTVVYPGLDAGNYGVTVTEADGTKTFVEIDLVPGEDWLLEVRLGGANELFVRPVEDGRDATGRVDWVEAIYSSGGRRTIRQRPRAAGSLDLEGIDARQINVMVVCTDGTATTVAATLDGPHTTVEVPLRGQPFSLRVVDPDGVPVPDARLILVDSEQPAFVLVSGTDARGECRLQGVPEKILEVTLQHGTLGCLLEVPVDAREREVELILEARARIELVFQDGTTPLEGVRCNLNRYVISDTLSGAEGRIFFEGIGARDYAFVATRADCWPAEFVAAATIDGTPQVVQMRRLGDLELQFSTAEGMPMRRLPVRLVSEEFQADVEEWITARRVPDGELVTDELGWIRLAGLPHGAYRWQADGPGGPAEGAALVEPGRSTSFRLALP